MRTLSVSEFVTLDGVIEAPGGEPSHPHTGWVVDYQGPEQIDDKFREVLEAELLLVGRVPYESFAGAWPTYTGEFADDNDLVDELRLMVVPVTIGSGMRLFPETSRKRRWAMTDTLTFPSRVRVDTYRPEEMA
jgi:dihydrofolate reductase